MNDLIKGQVTGNAEEFASKIGISRSMLMENIHEMKELGADIHYCVQRRSYFYANEFSLIIGRDAKRKVTGGTDFLAAEIFFPQSSATGHQSDNFVFRRS